MGIMFSAKGQQNFQVKGQVINIFVFKGHIYSPLHILHLFYKLLKYLKTSLSPCDRQKQSMDTIPHPLGWLRFFFFSKRKIMNVGRDMENWKGTFIHGWWECKMVQRLCKKVWLFLKNLNVKLSYYSAFPFLGVYSRKLKKRKNPGRI